MAKVTNDNARKYRYLGQDEEELDETHSETLKGKILKELLRKQLSKHVSLQDQLHNQRKFVRSSCEITTASTSGLASFEKYKDVESLLDQKQTLSSCGLTAAEVQFLLGSESESSALEAPHARRKRLEAIEEKLVRRQSHLEGLSDQQGSGAVPPTQHQHEERVGGEGDPVHLQPYQDQLIPAAHPINHLKQLARDLFPEEQQKPKKQRLGKQRDKQVGAKCVYLTEKPKSFWDMQQIPRILGCIEPGSAPLSPDKDKTPLGDKRPRTTTDHTKPFVLTLPSEDLTPIPVIEANRKSIEELRAMEKFKNYEPGAPSRTLYVKNLSTSVTPRDLAGVMGHFESSAGPKVQYRILGGRMKGQAFVTFPNEAAAANALELCNGYLLHDRPMVAVFGRKS